jgi:hypothetical protein
MKIKGDVVWVVYNTKPTKGKKNKPEVVYLEDINKKNTVVTSLRSVLK